MDFLTDHFKPQPPSRIILAYTVRPNDVIISGDDGSEHLVTKAAFGDPKELGFCTLDGRVASPWIFEFEGGQSALVHPRTPIRIKGLGVMASA